jgi:hypothetical protein
MARQLGDATTEKRLRDFVESHCEPRWFGDEATRFGWWCGTNEPYPRGQLSALLMLCEAAETGAWTSVFQNKGQQDRFAEPTVEGIDYPIVGIQQAWNNREDGALHVSTFAATPSRRQTPTSFRVTKLPNVRNVAVYLDGVPYPRWQAIGADAIEIETEVGELEFLIATRARPSHSGTSHGAATTAALVAVADSEGPATETTNSPERTYQTAAPKACSCC